MSKVTMLWPPINFIFWFDSDNQHALEAKNLTFGIQASHKPTYSLCMKQCKSTIIEMEQC
jgi:hypothetical protein